MICECENDGFCARYKRDMYGRDRELCAGINVDVLCLQILMHERKREQQGTGIVAANRI